MPLYHTQRYCMPILEIINTKRHISLKVPDNIKHMI